MMQPTEYKNVRIHIEGLVQGIGFRPHVYRTAIFRDITGTVENRTDGVVIHAYGLMDNVKSFIDDLQHRLVPPAACIETVAVTSEAHHCYSDFVIVRSSNRENSITRISPDLATCQDCLDDMRIQPHRKNYPFINCTNCGPRFSIITDIPYDREKTTMAEFTMCETCRSEFTDIHDRRYHAQPIACSHCGPAYKLYVTSGARSETLRDIDEIVRYSAEIIDSGHIVALMGLGGYHLICDGKSGKAVDLLRRRKRRDSKPFALMMPDIRTVQDYALLETLEEHLLTSVKRPVVLVKQLTGTLPAQINSGLDTIGVMLPYMPFHHLLFEKLKTPVLVFTSGNRSNEPIVISHGEARTTFSEIADCIVSHNRRIHNRVDDSVIFTVSETAHIIRRSRGWVPDPILTDLPVDRIAAFGGQLKNTFAVGKKSHIILSQHIGDLENFETLMFFEESYSRFKRLFGIDPQLLIHDLHPDYLSSRFATTTAATLEIPAIGIQHHEAHIASVIVEHGLKEPVIGVCYDGAGYGKDNTIWGGEIFSGNLNGFQREIHLDRMKLPGGEPASRHTWRMALSCLFHTYRDDVRSLPLIFIDNLDKSEGTDKVNQILFMLKNNINCPPSSSMGRLFDGVSALTGLCLENHYEGEAPMRLEAAGNPEENSHYPYSILDNVIDIRGIVTGVVQDILDRSENGTIAARFMNTIVRFTCESVVQVHERTGIGTVALSGGVFQNRYVLRRCEKILSRRGFAVYTNSRVPANDGGLALGQIGMGAVLQ